MSDNSLNFHDLIEERLHITTEDIEEFKHCEAFERLINASNAMKGEVGDFTGINICIHVASSLVLLGSQGEVYHTVVEQLKNKFAGVDLSVILTSAALYYILQKMIGKLENDNDRHDMEKRYLDYLKNKTPKEHSGLTKKEREKAHNDIEEATSKLKDISRRFELMNWMIGEANMEKLGIPNWAYNAEEKTWILKGS